MDDEFTNWLSRQMHEVTKTRLHLLGAIANYACAWVGQVPLFRWDIIVNFPISEQWKEICCLLFNIRIELKWGMVNCDFDTMRAYVWFQEMDEFP